MSLTSALYTGLSGLNAHQTQIDTIGNNIANVNTNGFKGSRTLFETQFYETLTNGSGPSETTGGTNPMQVGHGVGVATNRQMMTNGPIESTGIVSDLAIDGEGFFVLNTDGDGQRFTRDGAFHLDPDNRLVSADGFRVQCFGVDGEGTVNPANLTDIIIPLGTETAARSTQNVELDGDLSSIGSISTASSETRSQQLVGGNGQPVIAGSLLSDIRSADAPGTSLFAAGDSITVSGITKGGREVPTQTFVVGTTGNTLGDYTSWLQNVIGIQDAAGMPGNPGVTIEDGTIVVRGNAGEPNSITITNNDISTTNDASPLPFDFSQVAESDGAGMFTGFTVYDSLGNPVQVQVTFTLEEKSAQGPVWRFYAESSDSSGAARALGTGTVAFDSEGNLREVQGNQISIDRTDAGAASPLTFALDFDGIHGLSTQSSEVIMSDQDGFPPGMLNGYSVDADGIITGTYSNGLKETLGQVAIANFPNSEGMVAESMNLFSAGPNAGALALTAPGALGSGYVKSHSLEGANVDLGREFIGLVTASTGFQASSRVISTSNDMLNQLLLLIR